MSNIKNIFISVNSPGEIASWMKPTVKAIKKKLPNCIIKALLLAVNSTTFMGNLDM